MQQHLEKKNSSCTLTETIGQEFSEISNGNEKDKENSDDVMEMIDLKNKQSNNEENKYEKFSRDLEKYFHISVNTLSIRKYFNNFQNDRLVALFENEDIAASFAQKIAQQGITSAKHPGKVKRVHDYNNDGNMCWVVYLTPRDIRRLELSLLAALIGNFLQGYPGSGARSVTENNGNPIILFDKKSDAENTAAYFLTQGISSAQNSDQIKEPQLYVDNKKKSSWGIELSPNDMRIIRRIGKKSPLTEQGMFKQKETSYQPLSGGGIPVAAVNAVYCRCTLF